MGSAADAIEALTGVRPTGEKTTETTYDIPNDDTSSAASAMRTLLGIQHPTSFAERFDAVKDRPLQQYSQGKQFQPDFASRILTNFNNTQLAASQRTDPNPRDYKLVSGKTYENDAGELLYDDPVTGQLVKADRNKHVVLRDPEDNKLKVYERSANTDEGVLSSAGRMLGTGMATGSSVGIARTAASVSPESVIEASRRLSSSGAPVTVPRAISSDSPVTQEVGALIRNVPIANEPLTQAASKTISQLGEKSSEIAKKFGSASSASSSGETAKESIADWITKGSRAKESRLYDQVDSVINPSVKGTLDSTQKLADSIDAERQAAALPASSAVGQVRAALDRGGLTYAGVKKLRTTIGEQIDSGILPEGTSATELKRIYGALTDDLKTTVEASGSKPALDAFNRANTYARLANDRRESLAKIVGTNGDAPAEAVFSKIQTMASNSSRADIERLVQARKVMGADDWNELSSTVVSRMGRDVEGNFSPRRFLTDYGKLSEAGKNVLFRSGGKGSLADSLDDIARISSRFKDLEKYANPSGASRGLLGAVIGHMMGVEPLTMVKSVIGGRVLASFLANPAGASSIAKWSRSYLLLAQDPVPARMAAFTTATRNLISTTGVKVSVPDFLRALQSPATSKADKQEVPGKPGQ